MTADKLLPGQETFEIDVIGESTGQHWQGRFIMTVRTSRIMLLNIDSTRRSLLGDNATYALPEARRTADLLANLAHRTVASPSWWKGDLAMGEGIEDQNLFDALLAAVNKLMDAEDARLNAARANATQKLRSVQATLGED